MKKDDARRIGRFQDVGCLACLQLDGYRQSDCHHTLSGGRRRGHEKSVPLCPYHHRNVPVPEMSLAETRKILGPSLAAEPRKFREVFGTDDELIAKADALISGIEAR